MAFMETLDLKAWSTMPASFSTHCHYSTKRESVRDFILGSDTELLPLQETSVVDFAHASDHFMIEAVVKVARPRDNAQRGPRREDSPVKESWAPRNPDEFQHILSEGVAKGLTGIDNIAKTWRHSETMRQSDGACAARQEAPARPRHPSQKCGDVR